MVKKSFWANPGRVFGVTGLVLALLSPFIPIGIASWLLLLAGLVLGIVGLVRKDKVFGLIAVIVAAVILILAIIGIAITPVA